MDSRLKDYFPRDAALFPHMLDVPTDRVLVSRLSEPEFKAASFLDQRILTETLRRETLSWDSLAAISLPPRPVPHYIFHIGHVGSTLLSRLLGEHENILALREPHILRSLAEISQIKSEPQSPWSPTRYDERLRTLTAWLSRSFRPDQRSLIKASSFVSEIASDLIGSETKAVFLYVPLEDYLAAIFAGEGSRKEARQLAGQRITRLTRRLGKRIVNLWELSEGQIIALGWLTEMLTLTQTQAEKSTAQIYWQDFGDFLSTPARSLVQISNHLGTALNIESAAALASGPIMRSYSKAPEHDYSPDLRQQLLAQARSAHSGQIKLAASWVTTLANSHKEIEALMNRAQENG